MKTAFIFPGQGSQYVGMGKELYESSPAFHKVFDEADEVLGYSISGLCFNGPEEELKKTTNTQPALVTMSVACLEAMREKLGEDMIVPAYTAGHSLGEYAALVASGAMEFKDALKLVAERGRLMGQAAEAAPGAMAAVIGLGRGALEKACSEAGAYMANINCPGQIVISGSKESVAEASKLAKAAGAKLVIPLAVSGAFHSPLMAPAAEALKEKILKADIKDPKIPVVGNVTGKELHTRAEIVNELAEQICGSVLWEDGMNSMIAAGVTEFIEIGAGEALTKMVPRISKEVKAYAAGTAETIDSICKKYKKEEKSEVRKGVQMKKGKLARGVSVIGAGYTPVGIVGVTPELKDMSERELFAWASLEAMKSANIQAKDIDAYYVGMSGPNFYSRTKSAAPHFGAWIGMENKPSLFHDEGCGTGIAGVQEAAQAIAAGVYDVVIATCVNISTTSPKWTRPPYMREQLSFEELWNGISTAFDTAYEKPGTASVTGLDMLCDMYCREYGYTEKDVDEAIVKWLSEHRKLALANERGKSYTETYEEEAAKAGFDSLYDYLTNPKMDPKMATYVRNRYFGLPRDGASAVILCASDIAEKFTDKPLKLLGIAQNTMSTKDFDGAVWAAQKDVFDRVYAMSDEEVDPYEDITWMYAHDCPAPLVLNVTETAGFVRKGEAMKIAKETGFGREGRKHMNTDGGRSQLGHPLSPAFGIEVTEFMEQARGEAGDRQLDERPKYGLFWIAGSGWNAGAALLKADFE